MTAEEIVQAAIAENEALGWAHVEKSRKPLFRRISARQQQLFSMAGQWDTEWAGWTAVAQLNDGVADFTSLLRDDHPTIYGAERVRRVEISDPGASAYAADTEIHLVTVRDAAFAAPAPRATFRSGWLEQVGTDLAGVVQVRAHYLRRSRQLTEGDDEVELPAPHTELLVMDLARYLVQSTQDLAPEPAAFVLTTLQQREKEGMEVFLAHIKRFSPNEKGFDV